MDCSDKNTFSKVSVLIPMYNVEAFVASTIESVLNQTYPNIEIVIVDDHSTDNSYTIAESYVSKRVRLYKNPKKGACSARNFAFENSSGEYIQYLDADDYMSEGKIEKQMEALASEPQNTLAFSTLRKESNSILSPLISRPIDRDYSQPIELLIDMWRDKGHNCPHCYLFSRQLHHAVGGWDETILKNQDGEFFSRVIQKAGKIKFIPNEYAVWRLMGNGISSKHNIQTMKAQLDVIKKIAGIVLDYEDSDRTRYACASSLGWFLYLGYPDNHVFMPEIKSLYASWGQNTVLIPYKGKLFTFLRSFFGWRIASVVVKNKVIIKICSQLDFLK